MDELDWLDHAELREDVGLDGGRGGCGERDDGGAVVSAAQARDMFAEHAVVGPEIVSPLRDAMRLVDCDEGKLLFGEHLSEAGDAEALGGDEEEVELVIEIVGAGLALRAAIEAGVDAGYV